MPQDMLTTADLNVWIQKCRTLLESNQVQSRGYRYTRPAPKVYEYQWLWDSCFHALTYRWFDGAMAWDELLSVIQHQVATGADEGMIPHMAYWQPDGAALWGIAERSLITQPPLIAVAAWNVHQQQPNRAALRELYPALQRYHAWFDRRRDPDDDHLVTLVHPWESGWDASPRWDAPMGLDTPSDSESKQARHELVAALRETACDVVALQERGSFNVEAADYNAIRAADIEALAHIADALGDASYAREARTQAAQIQTAVREKMLRHADDDTGATFIAHDLVGADEIAASPDSAAKFVLLFGGCVSDAQAAALVAELENDGFATPYPVPTTPRTSPQFVGDSYWRGNVWLAVNWLIWRGVRRYAHDDLVRHLAERSLALVAAQGFHEYFDPLTGAGQGPAQQSWSAIVLDMLCAHKK